MINHMAANTSVSDYNVGSVIRTIFESVTLVIDEAYFQIVQTLNGFYINSASGADLDKRLSDYGLQRFLGQPATILLSFTSASGTPTIPEGTFCTVAATENTPSLSFITTADGTAAVGGGPNIPAVCTTAGSVGNLPTISFSTWSIANVSTAIALSVTNSSIGYSGFDQEPDTQFRARGIAFQTSLSKGTNNAYISACLNAVSPNTSDSLGVTQALVLEDYKLVYPETYPAISGYSGYTGYTGVSGVTGYTGYSGYSGFSGYDQEETDLQTTPPAVLYGIDAEGATEYRGDITIVVDNGLGSLSFDVVSALVPIINGDPSQPTLYPGYRASGIRAWITRPSILTPSYITLTIKLLTTILDTEDVETACKSAISTFTTQIAIGGTLYKSDIIAQCKAVDGVIDVSDVVIEGHTGGDLIATDPATKITVNAENITITTEY
jgi:hypothetical protein